MLVACPLRGLLLAQTHDENMKCLQVTLTSWALKSRPVLKGLQIRCSSPPLGVLQAGAALFAYF